MHARRDDVAAEQGRRYGITTREAKGDSGRVLKLDGHDSGLFVDVGRVYKVGLVGPVGDGSLVYGHDSPVAHLGCQDGLPSRLGPWCKVVGKGGDGGV